MTKAVNNSQKGVAALGKFRASVFLLYIYVGGCIWAYGCVFVFGGTVRALHMLAASIKITQLQKTSILHLGGGQTLGKKAVDII